MVRTMRQYIIDLYNSYSAIAERVDQGRLMDIHVSTLLDDRIRDWIRAGKDVILTGNPGDGKTHLIEVLRRENALGGAYTETDASEKEVEQILKTWIEQRAAGIPFVIAINHAPLRDLARGAAAFPLLSHLTQLITEIDLLVFYNEPGHSALENTIVVDLSQRELLTHDIVSKFVRKLSDMATIAACPDCPPNRCPVEYNASALSQPEVLDSLMKLFSLVTMRGLHTTMRDLAGLLAFILTGGRSCSTRWQAVEDEEGQSRQPTFEDYTYYNLLFENGRSSLFDAVRTFDPGHLVDPTGDLALWNGEILTDWLFPEPAVTIPANLSELCQVKRRYFFEHRHKKEDQLRRMLPVTARNFDRILRSDMREQEAVEHLIERINLLYAPRMENEGSDYRYRLRLWNSHRYAAGEVPGYFAMRSIPSDKLTIYYPKLTPRLEGAIEVQQDHVLLGVQRYEFGDPALRVDWSMYQALASADNGVPIALQPFHILRRLDLFLRGLGMDVSRPREVELIEWSETGRRSVPRTVRINRVRGEYEGVS